ncbi:MAG: hypothetical protein GX879_07285, partial [Bacteroidales bacterium]|nr:hypothetical protein [Bacteroidales bacterium]
MYDINQLNKKLLPELRIIARELGINRVDAIKKQDLIYKILDQQAEDVASKPDETKPRKPRQRRRASKIVSVTEDKDYTLFNTPVEAGTEPDKLGAEELNTEAVQAKVAAIPHRKRRPVLPEEKGEDLVDIYFAEKEKKASKTTASKKKSIAKKDSEAKVAKDVIAEKEKNKEKKEKAKP